ncbi:hypothetical protein ACJIZ3_024306 [Penstemon smallii]|uniref:Uncharacterized protein n=1 Tax=Penstemon smallii TaxID=265156 RepID=A0ABD3TSH0_9LAMI
MGAVPSRVEREREKGEVEERWWHRKGSGGAVAAEERGTGCGALEMKRKRVKIIKLLFFIFLLFSDG